MPEENISEAGTLKNLRYVSTRSYAVVHRRVALRERYEYNLLG